MGILPKLNVNFDTGMKTCTYIKFDCIIEKRNDVKNLLF